MRATPADLTDLGSGKTPLGEAIEDLPHKVHCLAIHQVDKRIAEVGVTVEVAGQVHEVITTLHATLVQKFEQHVSRVIVRQVTQHNGGLAARLSRLPGPRHLLLKALLFNRHRLHLRGLLRVAGVSASALLLLAVAAGLIDLWVLGASLACKVRLGLSHLPIPLHHALAIVQHLKKSSANHDALELLGLLFLVCHGGLDSGRRNTGRNRPVDGLLVAAVADHSAVYVTVVMHTAAQQLDSRHSQPGRCVARHRPL
mmetsp:Transcript_121359/g.288338  ORF Transcript_121359/g.288338 Transcript_121359/m.288338 type:complete len:255 (-) Transcript_121359:68-832(-)